MNANERHLTAPSPRPAMPLVEALGVLAAARGDAVVVTSMGSTREWPKLSNHPLDFHYLPSTMGGAAPLGLGLALAARDREVIVLSGDGSLLMSLGSLVTIVASGVKNLTLVVIDNGVYEVTGGQPTPAASIGCDYAGFAKAAGFPTAVAFDSEAAWRAGAAAALAGAGPRLVALRTHPVREDVGPPPLPPAAERAEAFRSAIRFANER